MKITQLLKTSRNYLPRHTLAFAAIAFACLDASYAATIDTTGTTLTLVPQNKYIGNGTLQATGGGQITLGTGDAVPVTDFAMTGGLLDITSGTILFNGGWSKGVWTNNLASMNVDGTLEIWDGNSVVLNALTGSGLISVANDANWYGASKNLRVGVNNGSGTYSGTFSWGNATRSIEFIKEGAGTQILSNVVNQSFGKYTLNAGILEFSVSSDATLAVPISGAGTLSKANNGTLTLTGTSANIGTIYVNAGTLKCKTEFIRNVTIASNAIFEVTNNFYPAAGTRTFNGNGRLTFSGGANVGSSGITVNMNMTGGLIDIPGGLYNGGWQSFVWANNKAGLNIPGTAQFNIVDGNNVIVDALTGSGTFTQSGNNTKTLTIGVNNGSGTFSGSITNPAGTTALVKIGSGTQTLTGANTYNGTTTVSNGTLRIDGNSAGVLGALTVVSGAFLGGNGSYGGNITLNEGAKLSCELNLSDSTLTCGGQLKFTNLNFADCTFTNAPGGSYPPYGVFTLIEANSLGTTTFANAKGAIGSASAKLYISGNKLMLTVVRTATLISFR